MMSHIKKQLQKYWKAPWHLPSPYWESQVHKEKKIVTQMQDSPGSETMCQWKSEFSFYTCNLLKVTISFSYHLI